MSDKHQVKTISLFTAGVITTISITLVLFMFGLTILVGFTTNGIGNYLKESMGVTIELAEGIDESSISGIKKSLETNPYVKSAVYISKEEAKRQLIADLGRDPEEVLGYNPAHSYFDVFVKSEYLNKTDIKAMEESFGQLKIGGANIISNITYDVEDITSANSKLSLVGSVLIILVLMLILISFVLIRSIIQLNIHSKRFLINTMQLVGATNSFIRYPFMWRMVFSGIIAGVLASVGITAVVCYVANIFPEVVSIVRTYELLIVYASVIGFGILITALATTSAVNRYLKMTTNKLYHV